MLNEMSIKVDAGLSFKFEPTEESMSKFSANANAGLEYEKKTIINKISSLTTTKVNVCPWQFISFIPTSQHTQQTQI